jgi:hypothetical protein
VIAGVGLPRPGELWRSGGPYHLSVRVLAVEIAVVPPVVEYEVLDDDGSSLTGPLRVRLDASWHATFSRDVKGTAA